MNTVCMELDAPSLSDSLLIADVDSLLIVDVLFLEESDPVSKWNNGLFTTSKYLQPSTLIM